MGLGRQAAILQHERHVSPELDHRPLSKLGRFDATTIDHRAIGRVGIDHGDGAIELPQEPRMNARQPPALQQSTRGRLAPDRGAPTERDQPSASSDDLEAGDRALGGEQGTRGVGRGHALARGTVLGRYAILRPIGSGGAGVVYRAYDTELERTVAIKVLHDDLDAQYAGWLLAEARSLARVEHPHVISVYDIGMDAGRLYIVMRYVAGVSMHRFVHDRSPPAHTLQRLFEEVCDGLGAVHDAGLLHRDLKPDNIMIDEHDSAWIVDFGLAQGQHCVQTKSRGKSGTWQYMAPERRAGGPATTASDQYSLCSTFSEVLAREDWPRPLRDGLERGLRHDPSERFESIAALRASLARQRRSSRSAWLAIAGLSVVAGLLVVASVRDAPVADTHGASWDEFVARPRVKAALQRIHPAANSATAHALATSQDAWSQSRRSMAELNRRESGARVRLRQACIDRVGRQLEARLHAHAELDPSDDAVAAAIEDVGSPQRCVASWLPRRQMSPPSDPVQAHRALDMSARLGDVTAVGQIDPDAALTRLDSLHDAAADVQFPPLWADYLRTRAWLVYMTGRLQEAVPLLEDAFFAALDVGETGQAARVMDPLIHALVDLGRYAEARVWSRRALADQPEDPADPEQATDRIAILIQAALVARKLDALDEARRRLDEAERLLPRAASSSEVSIYLNLERAHFHLAAEQPGAAVVAELQAVIESRAVLPAHSAMYQDMLVNLARTARRAGDLEIARGALEELDTLEPRMTSNYRVLGLLQAALLDAESGDDERAWRRIEPALAMPDLPPPLVVPLRVLAFKLARRLGHRDPFVDFDAGLVSAAAAGEGYAARFREQLLDAARDEGLCHLARASVCAGA